MARSDPQSPVDFGTFSRYQNGEMSYEEQHRLEKRMLEDPLVAEAYEGFLGMMKTGSDAGQIRIELSEKLTKRLGRNEKKAVPMWYYAAAASVMVSVGAYWLMFASDGRQESKLPADASMMVEKPVLSPNLEPERDVSPKPAPSLPVDKAANTLAAIPAPPPKAEKEIGENVAIGDYDKAIAADEREEVLVPASASPLQAEAAPPSVESPAKKSANARLAASASESAGAKLVAKPGAAGVDSLAMPVTGWEAYQAYLDKNTILKSADVAITVTFTVNADGSLSGFSAKGDQPRLFDQAIEIVQKGPSWRPAEANGTRKASSRQITLRFHSAN